MHWHPQHAWFSVHVSHMILPCHHLHPIRSSHWISLIPMQTNNLNPRCQVHIHQKNHLVTSSLHHNFINTLHIFALQKDSTLAGNSLKSMASLAASTAAASIGVSEMLGNTLNFPSRTAPSASSSTTFKTVALFGKKAAPPPKKAVAVAPESDELAKWYGKCHC